MKKLILAAFALTTAASVFAQGTIWLTDRVSGQAVNQTVHIYAPLDAHDMTPIVGRASVDSPAGSTAFGTRALIGASGALAQYGAATTRAQYVAAIGASMPESSLVAVGGTTTFRTGTGAGFVAQITSTITSIGATSIVPDYNGPMTFALVAWDNFTGEYPTWETASVAWKAGTIAAGMSAPFSITSLGGTLPIVWPTQNGQNLTSFNLYFIPEPTSFALAGLGAAALLIFRRRN